MDSYRYQKDFIDLYTYKDNNNPLKDEDQFQSYPTLSYPMTPFSENKLSSTFKSDNYINHSSNHNNQAIQINDIAPMSFAHGETLTESTTSSAFSRNDKTLEHSDDENGKHEEEDDDENDDDEDNLSDESYNQGSKGRGNHSSSKVSRKSDAQAPRSKSISSSTKNNGNDTESNQKSSTSKPARDPNHWTKEEDALLIQARLLVSEKLNEETDASFWGTVASLIPFRTSKQCRERYKFNLDPEIIKDDFTPEEDTIILEKQIEYGNRWALISKFLPGRSENAVKTRFKSIKRAQEKAWKKAEDELVLRSLAQFHGEKLKQTEFDAIVSDLAANKLTRIARTRNAVKTRYRKLISGKSDEYKKGDPLQSELARIGIEVDDIKKIIDRKGEGGYHVSMISTFDESYPTQISQQYNEKPAQMKYDKYDDAVLSPARKKKRAISIGANVVAFKESENVQLNGLKQLQKKKDIPIVHLQTPQKVQTSFAEPISAQSNAYLNHSSSNSPIELTSSPVFPNSTPKKATATVQPVLPDLSFSATIENKNIEKASRQHIPPIITQLHHSSDQHSFSHGMPSSGLLLQQQHHQQQQFNGIRQIASFDPHLPILSLLPQTLPTQHLEGSDIYEGNHDLKNIFPDLDEPLNFNLLSPSALGARSTTPSFSLPNTIELGPNTSGLSNISINGTVSDISNIIGTPTTLEKRRTSNLNSSPLQLADLLSNPCPRPDSSNDFGTQSFGHNVDIGMLLGNNAIQATLPYVGAHCYPYQQQQQSQQHHQQQQIYQQPHASQQYQHPIMMAQHPQYVTPLQHYPF